VTGALTVRRFLRYVSAALVVLGVVGATSYLLAPETEYTFRTVFVSTLAVVSFVSKYALASLGNDGSAGGEREAEGDKAEGDDVQVEATGSQMEDDDADDPGTQVGWSDVRTENPVGADNPLGVDNPMGADDPVGVDDLFESNSGPSAQAQFIHPRLQNMEAVAFEKFVAALFETQGWTVERPTPDRGIDLFASQSSGLVEHEIAVCLKQYPEDVKITTAETRRLAGLSAEFGTDLLIITTSSFTDPAKAEATRSDVQTVDGPELETFIHEREEYDLFDRFAPAVETVTRSGPIPAIEIPQADSIEVLNEVLGVMEAGNEREPDILAAVQNAGESLHARQVNYYTTAANVLDFVQPRDRDDRFTTWRLTRSGERYLAHLRQGDGEATARLADAIEQVEIVQRLSTELQQRGRMSVEDVAKSVEGESALNETTATRRAHPVANWLSQLPDVRMEGSELVRSA
jgi:hypothetical protein